MVTLKSKTKSGYILKVKDRRCGLDTTTSAHTHKKREADALIAQMNVRMLQIHRGELKLDADWTATERLHFLKYGEPPEHEVRKSPQLSDAINRYLDSRRSAGKSHNTVRGYELELGKATEFFGDVSVKRITKRGLQDWIDEQKKSKIKRGKHRGEKLGIQTIQKRVKTLQRLLTWLHSFDEIDFDPRPRFRNLDYGTEQASQFDVLDWQTLKDRKATIEREGLPDNDRRSFEKVFFSQDEVRRLLKIAEEKLYIGATPAKRRLFVALAFAAYTSARRSEIVRVQRKDVDLDRGVVRLLLRKGRGNKAFRVHEFPLHDDLAELLRIHLDEMPQNQSALFTANDSHIVGGVFDEKAERQKAENLGNDLKDALAKTEFELCSGWHIHRHSLISQLAEQRIDADAAAMLIGHKTKTVHLRYRHVKAESKRGLIDQIPSRGGITGVKSVPATSEAT